jgi:hypothetical protein
LQSVIEQGGSPETEQAVARALEWLSFAQSVDGRWDASRWEGGRERMVLNHNRGGAGHDADTGITGLALLTFLGAGHSHTDGGYREQVARGLNFLINSQQADGCLSGQATTYAKTYCHSMATFALAEAYAMTGDKRLEPSVRGGVEFIVRNQPASHTRFGDGAYRLSSAEMAWFWRNYLGGTPVGNPLAAPLHADLSGLPPLYLTLATMDPLADDTRALAGRLAVDDVAHECREYPGLVHGFLQMTARSGAARRAMADAGLAIRRLLG